MRHLLTGTALMAVLAIAAPVWSQTTTSTPSTTTTPYSQTAPSTMSQTTPSTMPQTAPSTTPQSAPYAQQTPMQSTTTATAPAPSSMAQSATEPMKRRHGMSRAHARSHMRGLHATHAMHMGGARHTRSLSARGSRAPNDNIANQLNRQELGRVSTGSSQPPAGNAPQGYPQQNQPMAGAGAR